MPAGTSLQPRFDILGPFEPDAATGAAIDRVWDQMRRENPRLYDGPVLLADREAVRAERLVCRRGGYKVLAAAAKLGLYVRALGVQGVVLAKDADAEECILLGRRGSETRIYAGMWENAPSGTVEPPRTGGSFVDAADFSGALRAEGLEELGVDLTRVRERWIALLDDAQACSVDVVLRLDLPEPIDPRKTVCRVDDTNAWEYLDTAWVPTSRLKDWMSRSRDAISPPTIALFRFLGWA